MKPIKLILTPLFMSLACFLGAATAAPSLVLLDAHVCTMDTNQPRAEAVAVWGHRIFSVGSTKEIRALAGAGTRIISAGGKLVLPGFNDAHVHFMAGGFQLANVNLREAKSPGELAEQLRVFIARKAKGSWITGGDWDHEKWPGAPLPDRKLIDAVSSDRLVLINRLDGHMALANTAALKLAGIDRLTPDPPGGTIVHDSQTGEPSGILKDAAMSLVSRLIPEPTPDEKLAALRSAIAHAAEFGVTSIQDMSAGKDAGLYQELLNHGELKCRIYAMSPLPEWKRIKDAGIRAAFGDPLLRIGGLKGFSDGSLGSSTAWFFNPYNDAPGTRGLAAEEMFPEGAMFDRVQAADRAGLQVMVHAIGDRANSEMLGIFERVTQANGARDRRFRIEHAQHLRPQDIARFAQAHVIASMQPFHCADDGRWAEKRIGQQRCESTYAFRSLLDAGVMLAFGSDWTVAPLDPLQGIAAAVTRRTLDGKHPNGWMPEQKISVAEAVRAYTFGSAFAEFQERSKGTITPGKLADLVVLDQDIFEIDPGEIEKAHVVMTIMNGQVVYERP